MFKIMSGSAPPYLSSLVTPCAALESRRGLRSASKRDFVIKRTNLQFGNRMFEVAGPAEWFPSKMSRRKCRGKNVADKMSRITMSLIYNVADKNVADKNVAVKNVAVKNVAVKNVADKIVAVHNFVASCL